MNAPKSWLSLSVAVLFLAACSSNNAGTTSGNGDNGSGVSGGNPGGSGATGATGVSNTGGSGVGNNGSGTGVALPQDPIEGKGCSETGNGDYKPCSTSADCACPLHCGLDFTLGGDDAGGSICTTKCSQDSECPDIFTHCDAHGLCTSNICEADGGSDETPFFGACDSSGTNDGTCEPGADSYPGHAGQIIGVCFQSGTAEPGGACDPTQAPFDHKDSEGNTKRPSGKPLCPVGYQCNSQTQLCQQLCDFKFAQDSDNDGGGCVDGLSCEFTTSADDTIHGGACVETGDGGCLVGGAGYQELDPRCVITPQCACPLSCEIDLSSFQHACEKGCKDTATDCEIPYTTCQPNAYNKLHFCNFNYCAQDYFGHLFKPDGGSHGFGGACSYLDAGDGTCQLEYLSNAGGLVNTYGYCVLGTAEAGQPCATTGDPTQPPYCSQGTVCVPFNNGPLCEPPCDPVPDSGVTGCGAKEGCFSWIPLPLPQVTGFCQPCTKLGGNSCQNSSECCDGFCDYNADAGTGACN